MSPETPIILGSRSPRRLELLRLIVPPKRIVVCPPQNPEEAGFDDCASLPEISARLIQIATDKAQQIREEAIRSAAAILCADTTIVVQEHSGGPFTVLGQPALPDWQGEVREWFERFYFGKAHFALTGVVILAPQAKRVFHVVTTVQMCPANPALLDWYLTTGESLGKAGGYALQGAGSVFIEAVLGSLSNVVGLPISETREMLSQLGLL